MSNNIGLIVVLIIILLILDIPNNSSFVVNREKMYDEVIEHKELFNGAQFSTLRNKVPWVDAGVYSDVRALIRQGRLNKQDFNIIFSSV